VAPARQRKPAIIFISRYEPPDASRVCPAIGPLTSCEKDETAKYSPVQMPMSAMGVICATSAGWMAAYAPKQIPKREAKAMMDASFVAGIQSERIKIPAAYVRAIHALNGPYTSARTPAPRRPTVLQSQVKMSGLAQ
jgi:hypothetical protein